MKALFGCKNYVGKNVKEAVGEVSSLQGSWAALKGEKMLEEILHHNLGIVASLSGRAGSSAQWGCWGKTMGIWSLKSQAPQPWAWRSPRPYTASTAASYLQVCPASLCSS